MGLRQVCNGIHELRPVLFMMIVQMSLAGSNIFLKLSLNEGISKTVLVAYRFIIATATMAPIALIFERKNRPKFTWTLLFQVFFCGLFGGFLFQYLYLQGLGLTVTTTVAALTNLSPAITFILAVSFGIEKLSLKKAGGIMKVAGTLVGVGGAMLLSFYKGMEINIWHTNVSLLKHKTIHHNNTNPVLGAILSVLGAFSFSLWLILQTKMSAKYPRPYTCSALMSFMAAIQSTVVALCIEKDWSQWNLGLGVGLYTVLFTGIVASALVVTLIAASVNMRGPLFVAAFNPLMLVLVAILASLLLQEKLRLGSILGGGLIICGVYLVLWGQRNEMKTKNQLAPFDNLHLPQSAAHHDQKKVEIVVANPTMQTSLPQEQPNLKNSETDPQSLSSS